MQYRPLIFKQSIIVLSVIVSTKIATSKDPGYIGAVQDQAYLSRPSFWLFSQPSQLVTKQDHLNLATDTIRGSGVNVTFEGRP